MSELGNELIQAMMEGVEALQDGRPLKMTTVAQYKVIKLLQDFGLVVSTSDGKRVAAMGAVKLNGKLITDVYEIVVVRDGDVLEVGKKKIVLNFTRGEHDAI